jgi:hypothetical protein
VAEAAGTADLEALLRRALAPVEPPEGLSDRLEVTLRSLAELAADELESWELAAMRDPRNWARPAAAVVVGGAAAAGLVVVRARQHQKRRAAQSSGLRDFAQRTVRDTAGEIRRLLEDAGRS